MSSVPDNLVKIVFDDGTGNPERLWAEPLSGDTFRLWNTPFFHYGVSYLDTVRATSKRDDEQPTFEHVIEKSGYRTIRFLMFGDQWESAEKEGVLEKLNELGASYEGLNSRLISLDVPPATDFEGIWKELERRGIEFEFADPTYDHLFPEN